MTKKTTKRYAVWGIDGSFKYLWVACLAAGWKAMKDRWNKSKEEESMIVVAKTKRWTKGEVSVSVSDSDQIN